MNEDDLEWVYLSQENNPIVLSQLLWRWLEDLAVSNFNIDIAYFEKMYPPLSLRGWYTVIIKCITSKQKNQLKYKEINYQNVLRKILSSYLIYVNEN